MEQGRRQSSQGVNAKATPGAHTFPNTSQSAVHLGGFFKPNPINLQTEKLMELLILILTISGIGFGDDLTNDGAVNGSDIILDGSPVVGVLTAGNVAGL